MSMVFRLPRFRLLSAVLVLCCAFLPACGGGGGDGGGGGNNSASQNNRNDATTWAVEFNLPDSGAFGAVAVVPSGYTALGTTGGDPQTAWVVNVDGDGRTRWQKAYGYGSSREGLTTISAEPQGGSIVAGDIAYHRSDNGGDSDAWVVKLDAGGNVEWQKAYGGAGQDFFTSIEPVGNDGYIAAGATASFSTDNRQHALLIRLSADGRAVWQKQYGEDRGEEYFYTARVTPDGGFIAAGRQTTGPWIVKTDSTGAIQWQKAYRGNWFQDIAPAQDRGYLAVGATSGLFPQYFPPVIAYSALLVKIDSVGNIEWQRAYGGNRTIDWLASVQQADDGGFILGGTLAPYGWVSLKLGRTGDVQWCATLPGGIANLRQAVNGGFVGAGGHLVVRTAADASPFGTACSISPVDPGVTVTPTSLPVREVALATTDTHAVAVDTTVTAAPLTP